MISIDNGPNPAHFGWDKGGLEPAEPYASYAPAHFYIMISDCRYWYFISAFSSTAARDTYYNVYHWLSLRLFTDVIVPEKKYYLELIF